MEEKEFKDRVSLIDIAEKQASATRNGLSNLFNTYFLESINTLIALMSERDNEFKEYAEVLKDFSYNDNLTNPSDLFPGIRTVSDSVNIDELRNKAQTLKDNATSITNKNLEIESLSNSIIVNVTKALDTLKQLSMEESKVYDLYMALLKDLDSVYDIGRIARNN